MGNPSQAGALTKAQLGFRTMADVDRRSTGWHDFTGNTAASGEKLTINGRAYELVNDAGMPGTGDVVYNMETTGGHGAGPWNDTDAATHMAAMINGDPSADVQALVEGGGTAVLLVAKTTVTALPLATTFTGGVVSAATMDAGSTASEEGLIRGQYAVKAADVTKWAVSAADEVVIGSFDDPGSAPEVDDLFIITAAGAIKSPNTLVLRAVDVGENYAVVLGDPTAVLAAGDLVSWQFRCAL